MSRSREPKERVARRVREFRKRLRAAQKEQSGYLFVLKDYLRRRNLANEWVLAQDVFDDAKVYSLQMSFPQFLDAMLGNKVRRLARLKTIESATCYCNGADAIMIRPVRIPKKRGYL